MRILSLAAAALAALLLTITLANAQEPPGSESGTRLEPGVNLVGWVGEPTSVSQLFREIPELEAIWAWDAELDDWIVAGRNAPEWLGGLGRVRAGLGLRLVLGGEESFVWQRPTEPTRGLVELRTGWNLVAWSGADGAPLEQVAKGIGWSLREVRRWDAANQRWEVWTSPERSAQLIATSAADQGAPSEEAEPVTVRRGEALWINVARAVNWLQPTDILPRLVFPGGASDELQARVRGDLESVLAFYGQQYGIQADPDFTVYVAKDAEALIQARKDDGAEINAAGATSTRKQWERARGWISGGGIVLKQDLWPGDLSTAQPPTFGDYTIAHEYTHILQGQLSDALSHATWLLEGGAEWAAGEREALNGWETLHDLREFNQAGLRTFLPTLRSTEDYNGGLGYRLGWMATDRLIQDHGADSWVEIWRQLAATEIGPHGRWTSSPDWRTALSEVSGVALSDFYADFAAWQRDQTLKNKHIEDADTPPPLIRGRVKDSAGVAAAGILVAAARIENGINANPGLRADTTADGRFAVAARETGNYLLSINFNDDCTRYYSDGQLIEERDEAQLVAVTESGKQGLDIRLPPDICGWFIRGQVVDDAGLPLADISISACETTTGNCTWGKRTALDGSFAVSAVTAGDYHLHLNVVDDCSIYYNPNGSTLDRDGAVLIAITDRNVDDLIVRVPRELCHQRVSGNVEGVERFLDNAGYVSVALCRIVDTWCGSSTSRSIDRDGAFAVAAPTTGSYRLSYNLDGCTLHYGPAGLTSNAAEAMRFDAGERDVRIGHRQIPEDMCAYQISGTIVGADGTPLTETSVGACEQVNDECASSTSDWIDSDGAFAIAVPVNGAYRLSFGLDGCTVYFGHGRLTSNEDDAWLFRVAGRSVQLSQRQVPAELCSQQISGRLVNAAGEPLAQVYISICQLGGDGCATWLGRNTDADGSFAVTVPAAGAYRLSFSLNGCSIYYRTGGLATRQADASRINVTEADSPTLQLRVPEGMCAYQIGGSVTKADDQPLVDTYISTCRKVGDRCVEWAGSRTDADGSFAVTVPVAGTYQLSLNLNGCSIYYRAGDPTTRQADASRINVTEAGNRNLQLRVPEDMCAHQIVGSVTKADGQPLADTRISACREADDRCVEWAGSRTDTDGSFAITVPADGRYRLSFTLDGCTIYFRAGGFATTSSESSTARVAGRDARLNPRQIPEGMCAHQIMGSVTKADGQPLVDTHISACREVDDRCVEWTGSRTDTDGSFAITVPADGRYRVSFALGGCTIYFRAGGFTTTPSERSTARVAGRDARLNPRQIPAEMCAHRIAGRFIDANGAPLAERWINAYGSGSSGGVWTDANGRFEIRVPSDGAYSFGIQLRSEPYCWYNFAGRALGSPDNPVRVSEADVTGVELRLPGTVEELCE